MIRIPFEEMRHKLNSVLLNYGFGNDDADLCARLFTESNLDGFESHGLNRFPTFIRGIQRGYIIPDAVPVLSGKIGLIEQWDGQLGPGNLNAWRSMERSVELAHKNGIGVVGLCNTNHWLRGGSYGWQAAESGCIAICWTNTKPNLPPWGAKKSGIGNNPLVLAVPREKGHIVLDMALSLYSYGKLESYRLRGEQLPFAGGYDEQGNLTKDPEKIEQTERILPVGFWKGSGLSILLDLIGSVLTHGDAVYQVGKREHEYGLSQIFIAIDIKTNHSVNSDQVIEDILNYTKSVQSIEADAKIYYPGERTLMRRIENLKLGIPVDQEYWQQVINMQ